MRKNHDAKVAELVAWIAENGWTDFGQEPWKTILRDHLDDALAEAYQDGEVDERKRVVVAIRTAGKEARARYPNPPSRGAREVVEAIVNMTDEIAGAIETGQHDPGHPPPLPSWVA